MSGCPHAQASGPVREWRAPAPGDGLLILYGGTFDPVHDGHLAIARAARDALAAGVHFMPAADPPHRPPPGASACQRLRMLELAVAGERGLHVDARELAREGRSYTFDTLTALRADMGRIRPVALLVGADSLRSLHLWHRWRELFGLAHFVVAERPGSPLDAPLDASLAAELVPRETDDAGVLHASPAGRVMRLRQPQVDVSATRVRALVASGRTAETPVPPAVAAYIVRHRLYAPAGAASAPV